MILDPSFAEQLREKVIKHMRHSAAAIGLMPDEFVALYIQAYASDITVTAVVSEIRTGKSNEENDNGN